MSNGETAVWLYTVQLNKSVELRLGVIRYFCQIFAQSYSKLAGLQVVIQVECR